MVYGPVRELPDCIRRALKSVGYGSRDINIETAEKISIIQAGCDGQRGFVILVNLESGEYTLQKGSWGGSNCFNPDNPVDLDDNEYSIPVNGAVIRGSEGYPRTFARITLHPNNMIRALPEAIVLTEEEKSTMYCYGALTSAYRKNFLIGKETIIDGLIAKGLLKRNAAGAVSITTAGKNTRQKAAGLEGW